MGRTGWEEDVPMSLWVFVDVRNLELLKNDGDLLWIWS